VFVVIGDWRMAPTQAEGERQAGLTRIVDGVSRLPDLVTGYWTSSEDGASSQTFIVFRERAAAEGFAADVRGNIENQRSVGVHNVSLVIHEVTAHT
jgi:hypothetical protein